MQSRIKPFPSDPLREAAVRWVEETVTMIGPGFHCDTAPEEYRLPSGDQAFTPAECDRLQGGLGEAEAVLGTTAYESICLAYVQAGLGMQDVG